MRNVISSASGSILHRRTFCMTMIATLGGLGAAVGYGVTVAEPANVAWPLFQRFQERFVQGDGRVIDHSLPDLPSTSEGQSYAMFFALVSGDRALFARLWSWTTANLMAGQPAQQLPAWRWGRQKDGKWGVVDSNSASDADLWIAYALLEAGRIWQMPDYQSAGRALLETVVKEEVVTLPNLGMMLLPAMKGFGGKESSSWRLNPSYLPLPLLRRFAVEMAAGPWKDIAQSLSSLLKRSTPHGLAPDWIGYATRADGQQGLAVVDSLSGDVGSYDAIRTYLWVGITHPKDPLAASVLHALSGMSSVMRPDGLPPEKIHALTGTGVNVGPVGFSAALLPYFSATGQKQALAQQESVVKNQLITPAPDKLPHYYDHVLGLFGTGWLDGRYRFNPSGELILNPATNCGSCASDSALVKQKTS